MFFSTAQTYHLSWMHGYYACNIFILGVNFFADHTVFFSSEIVFLLHLRYSSLIFSCLQVYLG